jgi:integrase
VPSHFLDALLGAVFGGVITIIVTVLVERLRAPHLTLSIEPPLEMTPRGPFPQKWRSLRVKVTNESLPRWANWWMLRSPGQQLIERAAKLAGLPARCVAHGLRKAALRRLAEHGSTTKEIAAVSGHRSLAEIERYTARADQAGLARFAIAKLPDPED